MNLTAQQVYQLY